MAIVPARLRNSKAYSIFQRFLRVLQFLSAVISLALFSARLYKVLRLTKRASTSNGAVEGILVAAVVYTLLTMLVTFFLKGGKSSHKILRWLMVLFDLLFVGAFIAVAYLTRPNNGPSGPCRKTKYQPTLPKGVNCNLPWGTFALAIVSTLLHALTALFHEVRDRHHQPDHGRHDAHGDGNGYSSKGDFNGNNHPAQT